MKGSPVYPLGQLQMALEPLWTSHWAPRPHGLGEHGDCAVTVASVTRAAAITSDNDMVAHTGLGLDWDWDNSISPSGPVHCNHQGGSEIGQTIFFLLFVNIFKQVDIMK